MPSLGPGERVSFPVVRGGRPEAREYPFWTESVMVVVGDSEYSSGVRIGILGGEKSGVGLS